MARVGFIDSVIDDEGNALSNVQVSVYFSETEVLVPLYNRRTAGGGPDTKTNPFPTGSDGMIAFFVDPGVYDVVVADAASPKRVDDRIVPMDAVSGAAGGILAGQLLPITRTLLEAAVQAALFNTGDVKWTTKTAVDSGFVAGLGQALNRVGSAAALWAVAQAEIALGNTLYGPGNGTTTFTVPNLKRKVLVGRDPGVGDRELGDVVGVESVTLSADQSGVNGSGSVASAGAHTHTFTRPQLTQGVAGGGGSTFDPSGPTTDTTSSSGAHTHSLVARAADASHENMQPSIVVTGLIKL